MARSWPMFHSRVSSSRRNSAICDASGVRRIPRIRVRFKLRGESDSQFHQSLCLMVTVKVSRCRDLLCRECQRPECTRRPSNQYSCAEIWMCLIRSRWVEENFPMNFSNRVISFHASSRVHEGLKSEGFKLAQYLGYHIGLQSSFKVRTARPAAERLVRGPNVDRKIGLYPSFTYRRWASNQKLCTACSIGQWFASSQIRRQVSRSSVETMRRAR